MPPTLFTALGFYFQAVLLGDFALRWWKPEQERRWGALLYAAMGLPAIPVGVALAASASPPGLLAGPVLLLGWASFGFVVDGVVKASWREPPRWSLFVPYVVLYTLALFGFWMPILAESTSLGLVFGSLVAVHTTMNIGSHFGAPRDGRWRHD